MPRRLAASAVSEKYTFGVFTSRLPMFAKYGRSRKTMNDASSTSSHAESTVWLTPTSPDIEFKLTSCPTRPASRTIKRLNADVFLMFAILLTSRSR